MRQKPNNLCNNLHRFSYTKSVKCVYSFQFCKLVHNLYECIVSPLYARELPDTLPSFILCYYTQCRIPVGFMNILAMAVALLVEKMYVCMRVGGLQTL